jgi:hypothetical protein
MFPQFLKTQRSAEVSCTIFGFSRLKLALRSIPKKKGTGLSSIRIIALEAKNDDGTWAIHDISSASMFQEFKMREYAIVAAPADGVGPESRGSAGRKQTIRHHKKH